MSKFYHLSILGMILVLFPACSARNVPKDAKPKNPLYEKSPLYTQVNLHYDSDRNKLSTINYQLPGFLPRCRKVKLNHISKKRAVFTDQKTNQQYTMILSGHTQMPLREYLKKVFAPSCKDVEKMDNLNKKDKQGIKTSEVMEGMTKQGVIYAIGYPPDHKTPTTEANQWTYWNNRFGKFIVIFNDKGKVMKVKD